MRKLSSFQLDGKITNGLMLVASPMVLNAVRNIHRNGTIITNATTIRITWIRIPLALSFAIFLSLL